MDFLKIGPGFGVGASAAARLARARIPRAIFGARRPILWHAFASKNHTQSKRIAHRNAVGKASGNAQRPRCRNGALRKCTRQRRTASKIHGRSLRDSAVCSMFEIQPDHRDERSRSRSAGAHIYLFFFDTRYHSHIMWQGGGAPKRLRFVILFFATLF